VGRNLGIRLVFSQARTPYHAETADVRPCLPKVCAQMELNERHLCVQVRRLELVVVSQEVVRQLELWRSPMPMSCWMKHVGLLVRCSPLSLTPLHSSASEALLVHSPRISSAHILMDGMTHMMRSCARGRHDDSGSCRRAHGFRGCGRRLPSWSSYMNSI
jgi:hypothetical protein